MRAIYFDEAGYTGNDLLNDDQPFFCYLGLISDEKTEKDFLDLKMKHGYSVDEVKGKKMAKSRKGQKFILELCDLVKGQMLYVAHNKQYVLACKIFEYIYEPVFPDVNMIFYGVDFHRYFANLFYGLVKKNTIKENENIFHEFQKFIQLKDNKNSVDLFKVKYIEIPELEPFYDFCNLYRNEIVSDIDFTTCIEKWLLDLTFTSFSILLLIFSKGAPEGLTIICDNSKPLEENIIESESREDFFSRLNAVKGKIEFKDSKKEISLQIADILVSALAYSWKNDKEEFSKKLRKKTIPAMTFPYFVLPFKLEVKYTLEEQKILFSIYEELGKNIPKNEKIENIKQLSSGLEPSFIVEQTIELFDNAMRKHSSHNMPF